MTNIERFLYLNRTNKVKIDCIGDGMIDEYYSVKVNRISPEFPMPIMHSEDLTPLAIKPGGTANVAHQLKHFNCLTQLISLTDPSLEKVCYQHAINDLLCVSSKSLIPVKRRFLDNGIQVNRWDIEKTYQVNIDHNTIINSYKELPNVAILSDYNKGFFDRNSISLYLSKLKNNVTIIDPKKGPVDKWHGCTIFKPNSHEAKELSGYSDWQSQCQYFIDKLNCRGVVITQSGEGIVGIWNNNLFEYKPQNKILVESVIGAGDCFIAILALAIAHQFELPEAAEIAYEAGRLYVQNRMNHPITPADLQPNRIIHPFDLLSRDFSLAFTNGCFDLIHTGHIKTLEFAKSKADKLIVALNSDDSVKRLKGPNRPIKNLSERMAVMSSLRMVDYVCSFEENTPIESIKNCMPNAIIKGGDYRIDEVIGSELATVYLAPYIPDISTTKLLLNQ